MADIAFEDVIKQVLSLSYEQTIILMEKMLENLKTKHSVQKDEKAEYNKMAENLARSSMNTMWEELKNDTW